jgi:aspartyl protease family protein
MANGKALVAAFLLLPLAAVAADINVIGLFVGKAVISIDGGKPRTMSVGETSADGIRLIAATSESAVVEYRGARQTLMMGQGTRMGSATATNSGRAVLTADARGHYITSGTINGNDVRFLVDTGATSIVLSRPEATRLGINYLQGTRAYSQTANGVAAAYRVKLDTVQLGDIRIHNVDAIVMEGEQLPVVLLGMSFLNRTDMTRDGTSLVLTRRY